MQVKMWVHNKKWNINYCDKFYEKNKSDERGKLFFFRKTANQMIQTKEKNGIIPLNK